MNKSMPFVFVTPPKSVGASADWNQPSETFSFAMMFPMDCPGDDRLMVQLITTRFPKTRRETFADKYEKMRHGLTIARRFAPC